MIYHDLIEQPLSIQITDSPCHEEFSATKPEGCSIFLVGLSLFFSGSFCPWSTFLPNILVGGLANEFYEFPETVENFIIKNFIIPTDYAKYSSEG